MGTYSSTYVGVFVKAKVEQKDVPYTILKNSKGKVLRSGKFDPETGEELIKETIYKKEKVYPICWDDDDFEFWTPAYHFGKNDNVYFLLNTNNKFAKTIDECETITIQNNIDIQSLIQEFKETYKNHFNKWSNKEYKLEVVWGVVNYMN